VKRLAIFCDGTWNKSDQEKAGKACPTNVVRLARRVAPSDPQGVAQVVYYDPGVGTGNTLDKWTGGAFGKGLDTNLYEAYRFLMLNYEAGDQIFLFGFSRGAYTVRSLAGMIRKCGILDRSYADHYGDTIRMYVNEHKPSDDIPTQFRGEFSICKAESIPIQMIGVWDTVGSLGIPVRGLRWITADKYKFHDVELNSAVRFAYQALAIDERRAPFEAARWVPIDKQNQDIIQTWFCGVHSDVGGGYARDGSKGLLSDIPLKWMRDNAVRHGLHMDPTFEGREAPPLNTDPTVEAHNSKKGLYLLTKGIDRVIGMAAELTKQPDEKTTTRDPTQSLHPSVLERWDRDPDYRPKNLVRYLQLINDPRVAKAAGVKQATPA
jgi:uncharacterized protein (DUF2235 family)